MKNIITVILTVLLVISVGLGIYFYTNSQNKLRDMQVELNKTKLEIQNLEQEKTVLKDKTDKALLYIEYLDLIVYPILKDAGISSRVKFDNDMSWLLEVEKRAASFNNSKLNDYLARLKSHDDKAFGLMMDLILGEVEKILK